jgi:hypothetical protein
MESGEYLTYQEEGMTLRDYFAAKAMQTIAANPHWTEEGIAEAAYKQADAMLKAREA